MSDKIKKIINASITVKQQVLENSHLLQALKNAADLITEAFQSGKKVYFCGNGGSAADAQHLVAELTGRFYSDRRALPAEALHGNTSYLTAVANDYGFDLVYSRMIEGIGQPGDVLVALSTSGNSVNILKAAAAARKKGMYIVGFTGTDGGALKEHCDCLLNIPSDDTPRIQESHIMLGHIICQLVEEKIFPRSS